MRVIRELSLSDLDDYTDLAYNTYPSFKDTSSAGREEFKKLATLRIEDENSYFLGMFEDNKLIAAMRLITFEMNYFNKIIKASGIASVAVHLMHKKEGIARELINYYEEFYQDKDIPIASLLPFRPDFYKKMGYGFGTKMNQYRIPASQFPIYYEKTNLKFMKNKEEKNEILNFYHEIQLQKHGMFNKIVDEVSDLFDNTNNNIVASFDENNQIDGYLIFEFINGKADNYTINNMYIKELHYKTSNALDKLLGFIRKQDDQVNLVIVNSQDEYLAYKFDNPLNDSLNYVNYGYLETNTQLIGIMYKVLDIKKAIEQCNYRNYNNATIKIKLDITSEKNELETIFLHLDNGKATIEDDEYDIKLTISIADFSSLFMGCVSIKGLYNLGLIKIDNESYLDLLDLAFYCPNKPQTNTDF